MIRLKSTLQKILLLIVLVFFTQIIKADSLKVLYLGNSHTFYNNLPQLTYNLALSNGDTILFESNTPGGCTLGHPENGHLYNAVSLELINSDDWDYVILQEHSLFAVIDYYRASYMYPGARSLDSLIKLNNECTETIIQLIWGKKSGGEHCINSHCTIDFMDFSHMQDSLTAEYLRLADTLSCTVAPTGEGWSEIIENNVAINLFDSDESHPSLAGSYLAACIYYAVLFQKSPVGLSFTGGLEEIIANYLQETAEEIVFENPALWHINGNLPVAGFEMMQIENAVTFTDTSINADYFLWDFGDGTTDTVQNPTHTYTSPGTYTISQEVSTNCNMDKRIDTVIIDVISSSFPINIDEDISIFKGSFPGGYRIISQISKMYQIDIYGLEGRQVYTSEPESSYNHVLRMDQFPAGLYILVIYSEDGAKTFKISNPG